MNRWGKIFVGAILVMSIMFMSFSIAVYSTHRDWKVIINRPATDAKPGEPPGLKVQLAELTKKRDDLKKQYDSLQDAVKTEDVDYRARVAKMERESAELKKIYDDLVKEFNGLKEGERTSVEGAQNAQESLDLKLKEIEQLTAEIKKTHDDRDATFAESVDLTDQVHEKEAELSRATSSTEMLNRQVKELRQGN
jgi:cell division protein FtsB